MGYNKELDLSGTGYVINGGLLYCVTKVPVP